MCCVFILGAGCDGANDEREQTCDDIECPDNSTCAMEDGEPTCTCNEGYTGDDCDECDEGYELDDDDNCVIPGPCSDDPCGEHGTCDDSSGEAVCSCETGYIGDYCESCYPGYHDDGEGVCVLDEQCMANTCAGHGECVDEDGLVSCTCDDGYTGDHCEHCSDGYHRDDEENCVINEDCDDADPCGDHGTCDDTSGLIECVCDEGYEGTFCGECYPGYHDDGDGNCVLDEMCLANTCDGHGTCDDTDGLVSCTCDDGYTGDHCEDCGDGYHRDADENCVADEDCDVTDPCGDHGTCVDDTGVIECVCDLGYVGDTCATCYAGYHDDGTGACVLDESCLAGTCDGHGTCDDDDGTVACECETGYTGAFCESCDADYHRDAEENCVADDDCTTSDPCGDHGTCDDSTGVIECICERGYDGATCADCYPGYHDDGAGACVLDESCLAGTCSGHGECDDESGFVSCDCADGYVGAFCQDCEADYHRDAEENCVADEDCTTDDPCGDHGTCDDSTGVIECVCEMGYDGATCADCYAGYHDNGEGDCVLDESCLAGTCDGHGTCDDEDGTVSCACNDGYTGAFCTSCAADYHRDAEDSCVADDDCTTDDPCGDHGTCDDTSGVIECICERGYDGVTCADCYAGYHDNGEGDCVLDESCLPGTCDGHGTCDDEDGTVSCACDDGYTGAFCTSCAADYHRDAEDNCVADEDCTTDDPCGDHGACDDSSGVIECVCELGYDGATCADCYAGYHDNGASECVLDESCLPGTCDGHGICDDEDGTVACACDDGYTGAFCTSCAADYHRDAEDNCVADDDCTTDDPCGDHGTCDDTSGVIECICERGYDGATCADCYAGYHDNGAGICVLDESCLPSSCSGHGTCDDEGGIVTCDCTDGYAGANCAACAGGYHRNDADECVADEDCTTSDPCGAHGTCVDTTGVMECICEIGWDGATCSDCAAGYHDEAGSCELDESCLTSSCSFHGDCSVDSGIVVCDCNDGYTGVYCDACDAGYHRVGADCVADEVCVADSCGDHGDCRIVDGLIDCVCHTGWDGVDCDVCAGGYHMAGGVCVADEVCGAGTCSGHGTCSVEDGLTECACDVGYTGDDCGACYPGYEVSFITGECQIPCPHGDEFIRCDGICYHGMSAEHCGGCSSTCEGDEYCNWDGEAATCECSWARCPDGGCYNFEFNEEHCGDCDTSCEAGEKCLFGICMVNDFGACEPDCDEQEQSLCCAGECHWEAENFLRDPMNCGGCGIECDSGEVCASGECITGDGDNCGGPCPGDMLCCERGDPDECVDSDQFNWSPTDCGSCNNNCLPGESCEWGTCRCTWPSMVCDGTCLDTYGDPDNCGGCGIVCDTGAGERCYRGECLESDGDCGGCGDNELCCTNHSDPAPPFECVDMGFLDWEFEHCGGCDTCLTGEECMGECVCPYDYHGYCGDPSTCTDFMSNENCGACDNACAGDSECQWREEEPDCYCEYEMCDGVCTNTMYSEDHCGADCGAPPCPDGDICVAGACMEQTGDCSAEPCGDNELCCLNSGGASECVNSWSLNSNPNHCGECGNECLPGEVCMGGTCMIPPGDSCDDPADFAHVELPSEAWVGADFCQFTDSGDNPVGACPTADGTAPEAFYRLLIEETGPYELWFMGEGEEISVEIYAVIPGEYCDPLGMIPLACARPHEPTPFDAEAGFELIFMIYDPSGGDCGHFDLVVQGMF